MKINLKNILIYFIGLNAVSIGVILTLKTNLGQGSWDAVNFGLSELIHIKLGYASMIINALLLLFITIYRRSFKYINTIIPIILNGLLINFYEYVVFNDFVGSDSLLKYLYLVIGAILLPLGLSLLIISTLPRMIFDEITEALMEITRINNFGLVRISFEVFALMLALLLSFLAGAGIGQVGIGTVLVTLTIGPLINLFLNLYKRLDPTM